jgi:hypothetical protein
MFQPPSFGESLPSVVFLDTVSVCNARCPFCPLFRGDDPMRRDIHPAAMMDPALFQRIITELAALPVWPSVVYFGYLGETLLDRHFAERLKAVVAAGFSAPIDILTNGAFLDEFKARQIAVANIGKVTIGFDGATEATYKKHRVRCDYHQVLSNIKRFARIRTDLRSTTRIVVQFVRTRDNVSEVRQAYQLFAEFLDPARDYFQDNISKDWASMPLVQSDLICMHRPVHRGTHGYCPRFAAELVVHCDGKIGGCSWDYNLDIAGSLGDINGASVLDVFRGPGRAAVDRAMRSGHLGDKPAKCRECVFLYEPANVPLTEAAIDDLRLVEQNPYALVYYFPPKSP